MATPSPSPTRTQTYLARAALPNTHPLASFLLQLITIKRTNLCLSADVTTTSGLLQLAEEVGDSICMLKTHADIIDDFGERTVRGLRDIARRKRFLVFEDRKFGDIGSTVQKQYTSGPLSIVRWAAITNAHIFPGPAIVEALHSAAVSAVSSINASVSTEISTGSPRPSSSSSSLSFSHPDDGSALAQSSDDVKDSNPNLQASTSSPSSRKGSIVRATTIESRTDHTTSPPPSASASSTQLAPLLHAEPSTPAQTAAALTALGDPPFARGLLLLAQMSSAGNLLTGDYTSTCVRMARDHRNFVLGFIAQQDLNSLPDDNFLVLTPGVSLPPADSHGEAQSGDGLGQQYRTPRKVILDEGCDVIIVGRGILGADDRAAEAERYRVEGWRAYEDRVRHPAP
ncbi:MAG: hypothetical protein M1819_000785 [Sarea resinae]|nr:MAG: hypothetical protein M1819_000785 [Sarea resinae]